MPPARCVAGRAATLRAAAVGRAIDVSAVPRLLLLLSLSALAGCASAPPPPAHSDALWRLIERDCRGAEGPRGDCLQVEAAVDLIPIVLHLDKVEPVVAVEDMAEAAAVQRVEKQIQEAAEAAEVLKLLTMGLLEDLV